MGIDVEQLSLRERKKARTRASLIEVSQRLFAERGYSVTTLDDICVEVEVTPQTLLRYFDSKARLAVAPEADAVLDLRAVMQDPRRDRSAISVWEEFVSREVAEVLEPSMPGTRTHVRNLRAFQRWAEKDPVLVAMVTDVGRELGTVLAAGLGRDWDAPAEDLHSTIVASALVAGRLAVWSRWLSDDDEPDGLLEEQLAVIAYVEEHLARSTAVHLAPLTSTMRITR
jgi:AcrR family transcriptional regulator